MIRKLQTIVKAVEEAIGEQIEHLEPEEQREVLEAVTENLQLKLAHAEEHLS